MDDVNKGSIFLTEPGGGRDVQPVEGVGYIRGEHRPRRVQAGDPVQTHLYNDNDLTGKAPILYSSNLARWLNLLVT